jgi:hypothetical protein
MCSSIAAITAAAIMWKPMQMAGLIHVRLSDIEPLFTGTRCGKKGADVRPKFSHTRMGTG